MGELPLAVEQLQKKFVTLSIQVKLATVAGKSASATPDPKK